MKRKHRKSSAPPNTAAPKQSGVAAAPTRPAAQAGQRPVREETEPTANLAPTPLWLVFLFGLLFYLGQLYVDHAGGGLHPQVYEPYRDYADLESHQPPSAGGDLLRKGEKVYGIYCVACHGPSGSGDPSRFIPPLAGSEWVLAEKPGRIIRIASKGLQGPLTVKGQAFGGGAMLAVGDQMAGDEAEKITNIAAVLIYVRGSFGNKALPVTVAEVKAVREKIKDRTDSYTEAELMTVKEDE
ncbi:MAG TPA: cytochrome c [Candidatus Eisenbacteria bacterium]|jgi:mono/diheme cytochrome c family protein|nr:cytochrome c [Candidatus Eisenbacteria bacterium]